MTSQRASEWPAEVTRGRALVLPSAEALYYVASALLEIDPPAIATVRSASLPWVFFAA